ncbi:Transcription factor WhiB [Nonomuraea maritima]|uniref:Transcription factor WhiB n=1 Tax=Nonomuraea maritima TaxID=683260 RepID=A0A1G9QSW1_9ACTN|nr:WhiB family transcriptional regulator [Nonomuraea maritima]SDM14063.1 Transcription factor WhiB [Nonomuraea maritima]
MTAHESAPVRADKLADLLDDLINAFPSCDSGQADLFIGPDDEPDEERQQREAQAKAVCLGCPARTACLAYALALSPDEGVWAGYTAIELEGLNRLLAFIPPTRREVA